MSATVTVRWDSTATGKTLLDSTEVHALHKPK